MNNKQNPNLWTGNDVCFMFGSSPIIKRGAIVQVFPINHMQLSLNTVVEKKYKQVNNPY